MGRAPCCDKANVKRGPWSPEEDVALRSYIESHGTGGNWISLPQKAGLKRCGKSCRLRWLNYLRPDIKHGGFTTEEDTIIYSLFKSIGSRWSVIASQLPGRTDNDVKNYWNTKLMKKIMAAGETTIPKVNSPVTYQRFHHPSPSPAQLHLPAAKAETFFAGNLPLQLLDSSSLRSSLSYQYQPTSDFSLTGYNASPPPDENSISVSAGSSSLTTEDGGGSGGISYSNWNSDAAYFDDAAFLPDLGYSSWADLLDGLISSGTPENLSALWANPEVNTQGVHQSLLG